MNKGNESLLRITPSQMDPTDVARLLEGTPQLLDTILDAMGDGLSIQDRDLKIIYQNKYMVETFGLHIGEHCYTVYEKRAEVCEGCPIVEAFQTGKVTKALRVGTTRDGEQHRFENIASVLRNERGEIVAGMELVRSVEERERTLDELRAATERLLLARAVFEKSSEGIMVVDQDNRIVSVNPAFESITGYSAEEAVGADPMMLSSERQAPESYEQMFRSLKETGAWRGEVWSRRKDGSEYWQFTNIGTIHAENRRVSRRVCVFSDITERKQAEEQIRYLAQYDALTKLPNRALYADRLQQALVMAKRRATRLGLLFIDLDRFKPVNDLFGHKAGDTLLQLAAQRMRDCVRESDTVARLGGDEFAVLLPAVRSRQDALVVAEKLRTALEAPFEIDDRSLDISCSIGGAFYPEDGLSGEALTWNADQAMYQAKKAGRNRVRFRGLTAGVDGQM